jgi:glycosyltransferase involved in cell wall biosynthesis
MRTLINGRFLAKPIGGVARVGRELLRALLEEVASREPWRRPALEIAAPVDVEVPLAREANVNVIAAPMSLPREQVLLPWLRPGATILSFANTTPLLAARSIVWIHDAHVFEAPESYSLAYRLWHQNLLRACVLRRFQIITVSDYSRGALIAHGANAARTAVISNGGDHILREAADASVADAQRLAPQSFVLLVGSRAKHKNLPFAVEALSARLDKDVAIAVVGLHQEGAYAESEAMRADPRVRLLPMVTDAQLRALYERARCVVIPSVLEGFSLPAAEAMWCGAPLVLANRTALPEVGGPAALLFEPDEPDALAACVLQSFEPETRATLIAAGATQREKFRWRASAVKLLHEYLLT